MPEAFRCLFLVAVTAEGEHAAKGVYLLLLLLLLLLGFLLCSCGLDLLANGDLQLDGLTLTEDGQGQGLADLTLSYIADQSGRTADLVAVYMGDDVVNLQTCGFCRAACGDTLDGCTLRQAVALGLLDRKSVV